MQICHHIWVNSLIWKATFVRANVNVLIHLLRWSFLQHTMTGLNPLFVSPLLWLWTALPIVNYSLSGILSSLARQLILPNSAFSSYTLSPVLVSNSSISRSFVREFISSPTERPELYLRSSACDMNICSARFCISTSLGSEHHSFLRTRSRCRSNFQNHKDIDHENALKPLG